MTSIRWLVALLLPLAACAADDDLLLHYSFDDGPGESVADSSPNGLTGKVTAAWVPSPSGQAVAMDGTGKTLVTVEIPEPLRLGTGSWTFSVWLKPAHFPIDDPQNQRRLFDYGHFPTANLIVDLGGDGRPIGYFTYRDANDKSVSAGLNSAYKLELETWTHVAVVFDRASRQASVWVNGLRQGSSALPAQFDGDFSVAGRLSLGSGWHNYWGQMDEVTLLRRAWTRDEIRAEFERLRNVFDVQMSPDLLRAERQEVLMESLANLGGPWAAGDFTAVRQTLDELLAQPDLDASQRSYLRLRRAQSFRAEGNGAAAQAAYAELAADAAAPWVHRQEAEAQAEALQRTAAGQPGRDPAASRTAVAEVGPLAAELFVAPGGDDAAAGTAAAPLATLAAARDRVRALRAAGTTGAIAVTFQTGEYPLSAATELTAEDSGTPGSPTVYRAAEPGGAVFYGGTRVSGFQTETRPEILARLPEEARGQVVTYDLAAAGITDYGELAVRGFGQAPSPPTLELFVNGQPMTVARWPNTGFVGITELLEPGDRAAQKPSIFSYEGERPARWTAAEDPWVFGYFRYLWADATIQLSRVDPAAHTLTFDTAYHYGRPGMDTGQGIQWYAFNLLEEIDQPGEWYLDRTHGRLYLWPPTDLAEATVEIGRLAEPMLILTDVHDVRLEGLTFDLGRFNGVEARDCERLLLAGCTVSRMAGNGVNIHGGHENGLLGCDIHTIGRRATEVIGGDRATLTPGNHFVENCVIHHMGRIDRTYTPAIQLEGVGNRVAHNAMYAAPSSVMRIEGNDHLIEYNEVYNAVFESDDQGAMELFANASYRGVVFRYNRFTNCGKAGVGAAVHGQAAIRFDDAISGMVVYGNVFIRSSNGNFGAVQMNSGRDNIMDNNLFIDCRYGISGGYNANNSIWRMLRENRQPATFFLTDLYHERYPEMTWMMEDPGINHLWRNIFYRCGQVMRSNPNGIDSLANGEYPDEDPGFRDAASDDYELLPNARALAEVGFEPLPLDAIGPYADRLRASWPVARDIQPIADWRPPAAP